MINNASAIASETDSGASSGGLVLATPIPDTRFYAPMRAGHLIRTGHELVGRLVTDDGEMWRIERSCCPVQS